VDFLVIPLSGFHWDINPMDAHRLSGNATGWISLGNTWLDMDCPVMLLAGFQWEINPRAVHEVSGHATDY